MNIQVGHSPDSDDAFMFWALANNKVDTKLNFQHVLKDIQTLNDWAKEGRLETSAISVHALAYVSDKYAVLRHGGSFGDNYGPMIVSKRKLGSAELKNIKIAIPGKLTSAYLALSIYFNEKFGNGDTVTKPEVSVVAFDEIVPAIQSGQFDAGVIIHESQLTYEKEGLHLYEDLGCWWKSSTGLPLPLGINVVRKDLGDELIKEIDRCMKESINLSLSNRAEALQYALKFARGMRIETSDKFVGMYVNSRTQDMGDDGVQAIQLLHKKGNQIGLVPETLIEFV
jgi:1,4-dihydroxy-6-naphthoate synthase